VQADSTQLEKRLQKTGALFFHIPVCGICTDFSKTIFEPERLLPFMVITGGPMRQKNISLLITSIMAAGIMQHADIACAQDNATTTVRGKMYICYFYAQNGTQNYEITFNPKSYVSVMDGTGYGLYLTLGSYFAGYYLVLNKPMFRSMRAVGAADDLIDTSDILTFLTGIATGPTIQGTGLTWTDFKNRRPFVFVGYQHAIE
jgi:hypothetical protein